MRGRTNANLRVGLSVPKWRRNSAPPGLSGMGPIEAEFLEMVRGNQARARGHVEAPATVDVGPDRVPPEFRKREPHPLDVVRFPRPGTRLPPLTGPPCHVLVTDRPVGSGLRVHSGRFRGAGLLVLCLPGLLLLRPDGPYSTTDL